MPSVPISPDASPQAVLELLYRLKVRDVMSAPPITAGPGESMRMIQYRMRDNGITGVPIVQGEERLLGLVTIGDVIEALDRGRIDERAESLMTRPVIVLEDDMPLSFATNYFNRYKFGRFPVLDRDGRLVGVVTASDIIRKLLLAMNEEMARLEASLSAGRGTSPALEAGLDELHLSFPVASLDFENAGKASQAIKKALKDRGLDPNLVRRAAVASYELELNQVIHSEGGELSARIGKDLVEILAEDRGPGIADLQAAMREGYSTANEWIRSLGFGAGMGLPNARRVADEFSLDSAPGRGTKVRAAIRLDQQKGDHA